MPRYKDNCPLCGNQKWSHAKLCRACYLASVRKELNYCADCDARISSYSTYCKSCAARRREISLWQSKEYRRKLSEVHKRNRQDLGWRSKKSKELKRRWAQGEFNNRATDEYRAKLSKAMRAAWARGGKLGSAEYLEKKSRSAKRARLRGMYDGVFQSPTKPEKSIMSLLTEAGIEYQFQYRLKGFYYDFYLPKRRILIEYDGGYWHNRLDHAGRDDLKDDLAMKEDLRLIRIRSPEARNLSLDEIWQALVNEGVL